MDNNIGDRPVGVAWIDHAFSLSQQWVGNANPGAVGWYLPDSQPDQQVRAATAEKIRVFPEKTVREIVSRIRPEWLKPELRELIVEKLIERRGRIRTLCAIT